MAFGTRGTVTIGALVATALLAGCGGGASSANRLTLTDDACTYDGDRSPPAPETFEAEVVNESSKLGAFEIARIDADHTFAEVKEYVESERQRLEDGLQIAGPPTFMTLGARAQASPGESGTLVSTVQPGTWVLWCAHDHPPTALFLIEPPLEIDE
jgi:hypothetical protein